MNLFLLLGQLGLTWDYQRRAALPDRHALRPVRDARPRGHRLLDLLGLALRPRRHAVRDLALARGRRAPVDRSTPGIGIETPGLTYAEPCYARELEWLLLDALDRLQQPDGESLYLRLSTKPIDQAPFAALVERARARTSCAPTSSRAASACARRDPPRRTRVLLATCGAMVPEALAAAELLAEEEGVEATVLVLSSPRPSVPRVAAGPHRAAARRAARRPRTSSGSCSSTSASFPSSPSSTASSHALAWLGSALGTRCVPLGVDRFGQTGTQPEVYAEYDIDPDSIVTAALVALEP